MIPHRDGEGSIVGGSGNHWARFTRIQIGQIDGGRIDHWDEWNHFNEDVVGQVLVNGTIAG